MSSLAEPFRALDVSAYPDVHAYTDDLDALLWVLKVAADRGVAPSLTAAQASDVLREVFGRDVSRQRAASLLRAAKGLVAVKHGSREKAYVVMKNGSDRLMTAGNGVLVVEPSGAFTALNRLEVILGSLTGNVMICDPYIDDKTLVHLTAVPKISAISLLTVNISDPAKFRGKVQAYQREYGNLHLRTDAKGDLHDRYIIDDVTMWSLGQSLNGVGKKQTLIVKQGGDVRAAMRSAFTSRWNIAQVWK